MQGPGRKSRPDEEGGTPTTLVEASESLRLLVEGTRHFFFYSRRLDGEVGYVSPTVEAITGRPAASWLGHPWVLPDNPLNDTARATMRRHLQGVFGGEPFTIELRNVEGRPITLEVFESGRFEGGRLVGLLGVALDVTARARAEQVRAATLGLSHAALAASSLDELFPTIHAMVGELMPARNFYIALFDETSGSITFPYFVDEVDAPPPPRKPRRGVTEYVLRTGEPLLASPEVVRELEDLGEVELIGAPSVDWLGVPLKIRDRTIGVLVVQSYTEGVRYREEEKDILMFVSTQVAMAIERTRAEQALRESEATKRAILDALPDLIFRINREGVILDYKAARASDLLIAPSGFLGRRVRDVLPAEVAEINMENLAAALADGEVHVYEYDLPAEDDVRSWEARMVACGEGEALVLIREVTGRRQAEQELRESEERYRALVELSPDGIAVHSGGKIVFANARGAHMLGYSSPEALIGRSILELVHPDYRAAVVGRVRRALAEQTPQPVLEEKFLRADGSAIDVEVASIPFTNQGKPAVQVVVRDITARLRMEDRLRQAQKLEAVGQLAGGVAHDFNNLLQAALSTVQVLQARGLSDGQAAASAAELETYIKRGASLTRQLLLFSRREVTRFERLDLNAVVTAASELLRRLVPENIHMLTRLLSEPLPVDGDRGQLEQVLVNLIVNACDAMPEGGELEVRSGREGDSWAWFEVEDSGTGVPPDAREHIFDPFFTTKGPGQGSGLGLAVVHGIITRHEGQVAVSSSTGRGSTFRVLLPVRLATGREAPPAGTARSAPVARPGERVLLVEDEGGAREAISDVLGVLGYQVTAVDSAEAAMRVAADGRFDALLTDLLLPGVHGGELAAQMVQRWPDLAVIVMSGYAKDSAIRRGITEGSLRYLQKPFDMDALAGELRSALDEKCR